MCLLQIGPAPARGSGVVLDALPATAQLQRGPLASHARVLAHRIVPRMIGMQQGHNRQYEADETLLGRQELACGTDLNLCRGSAGKTRARTDGNGTDAATTTTTMTVTTTTVALLLLPFHGWRRSTIAPLLLLCRCFGCFTIIDEHTTDSAYN